MSDNDLYSEGPTAEAHEAELSDLDVFLGGLPEETVPTTYIRIQHSAVGVRDVPVEEDHQVNGLPGYILQEVLQMALSLIPDPGRQDRDQALESHLRPPVKTPR